MNSANRLREVRHSRGLSLQAVADKAQVSVATLSRIETGKQGVELRTFLQLARILRYPAGELIGAPARVSDQVEPVVESIGLLSHADRIRLWRRLAILVRSRTAKESRSAIRRLDGEVEELLAQLDLLHAEIASVRKRMAR